MKKPVSQLISRNVSAQTHQRIRLLPSFVGYSILIGCAILVFILMQYQYWRGEFGYFQLEELKYQVRKQEDANKRQKYINNVIRADVNDLKTGASAIEEHARMDLGFIKAGETFVQVSNASSIYGYGDDEPRADTSAAIEPIDEDTLNNDKTNN